MKSKPLLINNIHLRDVGGFHDMEINFNKRINVICGPNGVGKTTILDAIGSIFYHQYGMPSLRRRAGSESGKISYSISADGSVITQEAMITNFEPLERQTPWSQAFEVAKCLIYIKSNRDFQYTLLEGVLRDPNKESGTIQHEALQGINVSTVKQWFSNRYLMEPHGEYWPDFQHKNLRLAKSFFSLLDKEISLSHVDSSTFEILLNTPSGLIPFEYMSAGFRTSYGLILGILQEIEFRKLETSADEFSGVILVDELDLHLHPTWHGAILTTLETAFPQAQIIITTHSPHMIQHSRPESVIILPRLGSKPRDLRDLDPEFGFIGWTVEEILRDVMGMEDARPPAFAKMMERYESAITRQDDREIEIAKSELLRALHPSSVVRQIVEIESL